MPKDIAIIGAGCAGLGAAFWLMEESNDVDVKLIDANDWIGGRARTSTDPQGLPVDLGPQFIQDPAANPWAELLKVTPPYDEMDIEPIEMETRFRMRQENGWITVDEFSKGISNASSQLFSQYEVASKRANESIMTGNGPEFCKDQESLRLGLGSNTLGAIGESTEPWKYVASDHARQIDLPNAGNIYVPEGLGTFIAKFGADLIEKYKLRLSFENETVQSVDDTFPDKVMITMGGPPKAYDFCIVTVPSPVLDKLEIYPALPEPRVRADGFITLGSYKKVGFRPKAFPNDDADDAIKTETEYYIYDEDRNGVWQYFRLPTEDTILICVAAGDFARQLDDLQKHEVFASVTELLKSAHPGGDFAAKEGKTVVTNWTDAPHVRGAYSFTRYDSQLGPDDPTALQARPQLAKPHGRIHFAGEATYLPAYGTIHGAFLSGIRAAQEIVAAIKG